MKPSERLSDVFDRGLSAGIESLSPPERELFRIQDFIIEYEMGGLTTYLYNRLPDFDGILATVAAMRRYGLAALADLVGEAADLFRDYDDSDAPPTWGEILRRYDPKGRLDKIHKRIAGLDNYGLDSSSIN
jgi:hypothetical protein